MRTRIHACQLSPALAVLLCEEEDTCMSYQEDTCMSYEEEDTCMSYEEEDTCMSGESSVSCAVTDTARFDMILNSDLYVCMYVCMYIYI